MAPLPSGNQNGQGGDPSGNAADPFDGNDPFLTHNALQGATGARSTGRIFRIKKGKDAPQSKLANFFATSGLIIAPWMLFCGLSCMFTFAYHHLFVAVWLTVLASTFFCLGLMVMASRGKRRMWLFFMGVLCLIATCCAAILGSYNYHEHMFAYWSYTDNGVYTNLLPSEPAASHQDAGKIFFSDDARVDTTKAVGYKDGSVYCVAPILDDVPIAKVEYWAVGMDCCSARADFNCDDAWNAKAKSGVAILDSNSWIPSKRDAYTEAVKLSEFTYDIKSAATPVFVRWVAEPEIVQDDFWRSGVGFLVAEVCIYLLISIIFGLIADQSIKRQQP